MHSRFKPWTLRLCARVCNCLSVHDALLYGAPIGHGMYASVRNTSAPQLLHCNKRLQFRLHDNKDINMKQQGVFEQQAVPGSK